MMVVVRRIRTKMANKFDIRDIRTHVQPTIRKDNEKKTKLKTKIKRKRWSKKQVHRPLDKCESIDSGRKQEEEGKICMQIHYFRLLIIRKAVNGSAKR